MTTLVVVHGGGMGGWTWKYVREILEAGGHKVYTPTFTGFGEREHLIGRDVGNATHVRDIVNVFKYEDLRDVVLVAHSYAGTVAPGRRITTSPTASSAAETSATAPSAFFRNAVSGRSAIKASTARRARPSA